MQDDHGGRLGDATTLALGSYQFGRIEEAGDVDSFRVNVTEPGNLTVYTEGSLDTVGELGFLGGDHTQLLSINDDGGEGSNFRIERQVRAGSYIVDVRGDDHRCTGEYTVRNEFTPN